MKNRLLNALCLLAVLAIAGCRTPEPLKKLSKDFIETQATAGKAAERDLEQSREFVLKAEEVLRGQQALTDAVSRLATQNHREQALRLKKSALSRFDKMAFGLITKDFDERWEKIAGPPINRFHQIAEAEFKAAETAALQDRSNATLQERYARSMFQLARFEADAERLRLESHHALILQIEPKRATFEAELTLATESIIGSGNERSESPGQIIQDAQVALNQEKAPLLTNTLAALKAKLDSTREFNEAMRDTAKEIDRYLQNDGDWFMPWKAFFTGFFTSFKEKIPLLKEKISKEIPWASELATPLLDTVDSSLASLPDKIEGLVTKNKGELETKLNESIASKLEQFLKPKASTNKP
ncbi:MAG: hypothetical protein EXS35_09860 [Pedosphaera sp.]|nr:hypothetical protein [Pedosphaera sp.]